MKALKLPGAIILSALCFSAYAQSTSINSLPELGSFMQSDYNYIEEQRLKNAKIEGSPYLEEEFSKGSLMFRGTYYADLLLRYNMYNGYFEFKSDDQVLYFDPRYTEVDTVWIGEDTFIFQEHEIGKSTKRSYMQLLYDSDAVQVLNFREIILLQPEKAAGYEDAKPARFQPRADRQFVRFPGKPALEFSGRKSIPDLFPGQADELTSFAKKKRLRFRKVDELIELCKYYDNLQEGTD